MAGVVLLMIVVLAFGKRLILISKAAATGGLLQWAPWFAIFILIMAVAVAVGLGELGAIVLPGRLQEGLERRNRETGSTAKYVVDLTSLGLISLIAAGPIAMAAHPGSSPSSYFGLESMLVGEYELPGPPMDYEPVDAWTGYVSVATGEIYLVRLPSRAEDEMTVELVADDLIFPRGIAVSDGILYVGDIGALSCEDAYPTCFGKTPEGEKEIIEASSGTLIAYDIADDMTLFNRRDIVTDLPVVTSEHGVNDVETGPDGAIYVAIGHVAWMWEVPDEVSELNHSNIDLLGTIIRVDPDSGVVSIYASGMRNVYGFDFDDAGRILAADNDGWTTMGWYPEGVLVINGGEYFGYPWGGGPGVVDGATPPLWQLARPGSSAAEWVGEGPWSPGLLVGGWGGVSHVALGSNEDRVFVRSGLPESEVLTVTGYVTAIEQLGANRLLVAVSGVYGSSPSSLRIIEMRDEGATSDS